MIIEHCAHTLIGAHLGDLEMHSALQLWCQHRMHGHVGPGLQGHLSSIMMPCPWCDLPDQ